MKREKGLFIVVDGNEACGKTSAIEILDKYIKGKNQTCVSTRAIGHGSLGVILRPRLLSEDINKHPFEELNICISMIVDAINNFVVPNVSKGTNVILDRYFTSTLTYQVMEKYDLQEIDLFAERAFSTIIRTALSYTYKPDMMILIQSDYNNTNARLQKRTELNRLDIMDEQKFLKRQEFFVESFSKISTSSKDKEIIFNNGSFTQFENNLISTINKAL